MLRAFHYGSSTPRQTEKKRTERAVLRPSSLWPRARPALTEEDREREGVCECACVRVCESGANISLAGSPGHGGGQGSVGEGEAACPAVN